MSKDSDAYRRAVYEDEIFTKAKCFFYAYRKNISKKLRITKIEGNRILFEQYKNDMATITHEFYSADIAKLEEFMLRFEAFYQANEDSILEKCENNDILFRKNKILIIDN